MNYAQQKIKSVEAMAQLILSQRYEDAEEDFNSNAFKVSRNFNHSENIYNYLINNQKLVYEEIRNYRIG